MVSDVWFSFSIDSMLCICVRCFGMVVSIVVFLGFWKNWFMVFLVLFRVMWSLLIMLFMVWLLLIWWYSFFIYCLSGLGLVFVVIVFRCFVRWLVWVFICLFVVFSFLKVVCKYSIEVVIFMVNVGDGGLFDWVVELRVCVSVCVRFLLLGWSLCSELYIRLNWFVVGLSLL